MLAQIDLGTSALPLTDILLALVGEWSCERLQKLGGSAVAIAPEAHAQSELHSAGQINFPGQGDVTIRGLFKFPIHFEVVHQVLPAVAESDVADRSLREIGCATE